MTLQFKHIAPYIPYKLQFAGGDDSWTLLGAYKGVIDIVAPTEKDNFEVMLYNGRDKIGVTKESLGIEYAPILRPISDINNKKINDDILTYWQKLLPKAVRFHPKGFNTSSSEMAKYKIFLLGYGKGYDYVPHWMFQELIKWHFDVFGLIGQGLAIDINSLTK